MKGNDEQMAKLQKELQSGEFQRKLDQATRLLEEARKQMAGDTGKVRIDVNPAPRGFGAQPTFTIGG